MRYFVRSLSALALVLMSCTSSPAPDLVDAGIPHIGKPVLGSFGNFPPTPNPSSGIKPLIALPNSSICDSTGQFCFTTVGGIAGFTTNGGASANLYTTGTGQTWITTTDFSPNPSRGTSLGVTQPFGPIHGDVFISDRGNSTGVFSAYDAQALNISGIAIIGGSGGNGYIRFGDASGTNDSSIFRSGVGGLSVGTGDNTGSGTFTASQFLGATEKYLSVYDAARNSTSNKIQSWIVTYASTLADAQFVTSVVGVGGGNYVVKLCSDGTTCSGANLKATLTVSCTAAADTSTSLTVNNGAIAAASTLTLTPSTACGTTAESGNFVFHLK
jgi:hypothetical protein